MVIIIKSFLYAGKGDDIYLDNITKTAATINKSIIYYWEHVVTIIKNSYKILDLYKNKDTIFYSSIPEI